METLVERKELVLTVPRIVFDELARNKDRIVEESGRSLMSALKRAREAVAEFGERRRRQSALREIDEVDHKLVNLGDDAAEMLSRVGALLKKAKIIELTNALKVRAANRGIEKKAPFHRQRNGMGDAVIIEAYAEVADSAMPLQRTAFVTHNTKDFSHPTHNKLPHPDLAPLFGRIKSRYFITLGEALRSLGSEEFADLMIEERWANIPARRLKEIVAAEDELTTKVWYNRHMIRREMIEAGKIKLVDKDTTYGPGVIQKDIWEGATKAAADVEKRLGVENLGPWDDFEWGMINGKLSTVRWVLGDDWDMLDT
jgi:hypothetical protein